MVGLPPAPCSCRLCRAEPWGRRLHLCPSGRRRGPCPAPLRNKRAPMVQQLPPLALSWLSWPLCPQPVPGETPLGLRAGPGRRKLPALGRGCSCSLGPWCVPLCHSCPAPTIAAASPLGPCWGLESPLGVFLHLLQLLLALPGSLGPARHPRTHHQPWMGPGEGAEPSLPWVMRRAPAMAPRLPISPHPCPSPWHCPLPWLGAASSSSLGVGGLLTAGYCAGIKPVCTFIVVLPLCCFPSSPGATAQAQHLLLGLAGEGGGPGPPPSFSAARAGLECSRWGMTAPSRALFPFKANKEP